MLTRNQVLTAFGPKAAALTDAGIWPDAGAVARRLKATNRRREASGRRYDARVAAMRLRGELAE